MLENQVEVRIEDAVKMDRQKKKRTVSEEGFRM